MGIYYTIFYFSLCEQYSQINSFLFLILFFNSYFFACELGIKKVVPNVMHCVHAWKNMGWNQVLLASSV